jgi:hypothetical protein
VPVRSKAKDPGHSPKSRGLCVGKPRLGGPEPRPSPVTPRNALGEGAAREGTVELNPRRFRNAKAQPVDTGDASCPVLPPATLDVSVAARNQSSAMKLAPKITPIIPIHRDEIPTDPAWAAELKLAGFRGIADTIRGKLVSKNLNPLKRLRHILHSLPLDCVFDGEICVLDRDCKPQFNDLLFGRADPVHVSDLLFCGGKIFRPCHCKRLGDEYSPQTQWFKVLNKAYSQKENRHEYFPAEGNVND